MNYFCTYNEPFPELFEHSDLPDAHELSGPRDIDCINVQTGVISICHKYNHDL
jgi:hypothetical protein